MAASSRNTCCWPGPNQEVKGYYLVGWGRSAQYVSQITLQAALIAMAYRHAGCRQYLDEFDDGGYDDDDALNEWYRKSAVDPGLIIGHNYTHTELEDLNCDGAKSYGFKPTSIVSNVAFVGGILSAVSMPLMGAIVDSTKYRKPFGIVMAATLTLVNFFQTFITKDTWFLMAVLQGTAGVLSYMGLAMVVYAYVPELGDSVEELSNIMGNARLWEQGGMLFLLVVVAAAGIMFNDPVLVAVVGQITAVVVGGPAVMYATTRLYTSREAADPPPEGRPLLQHGFIKVYQQVKLLTSEYPQVGRYLLANVLYEASTTSITTAATIWLSERADFPLSQISIFIGGTLICMMPGTLIHKQVVPRLGFKKSLLLNLAFMTIVDVLFAIIATSPPAAWPFAPLLGLALGWYYPTSGGMLVQLIPPGKEAEMSGLSMLTSSLLSWFPALMITIANESDNLIYGQFALAGLWTIGAFIIASIDEQQGLQDVKNTTDKVRQHFKGGESTEMTDAANAIATPKQSPVV